MADVTFLLGTGLGVLFCGICWVVHYWFVLRKKPSGNSAMSQNIDEDGQTSNGITATEVQQQAILDAIHDAMFRIRKDGPFYDFIPAENFNKIISGSLSNETELTSVNIARESLHYLKAMEHIQLILESEGPLVYEYQVELEHQKKDYEARMVRSGENEVLIIVRDVTEHNRTRNTLTRFRFFMDQAGEAILLVDPDTRKIIDFNKTATDYLQYSAAELHGLLLENIRSDQFTQTPRKWKEYLEMLRSMDKPLVTQGTFHRKDRSWFYTETVASTQVFEDQEYLLLTIRDITERKEAGEQLARLVTAIEQMAESIIVTDPNGIILYVNPAFRNTTGFQGFEVIGHRPSILKSGLHDTVFYENLWKTIQEGNVWHGHLFNRKKSGDLIQVNSTISPVLDAAGHIINFIAIQHDVTYEKQLESHIRQSQKMEAIGTLAGGIAHDFNNMLFAMMGYTEMASQKLPRNSRPRQQLEEVLQVGQRAKELIQQILTFSRRNEQEFRTFQIQPLVKEVIKMIKATLPSTIQVHEIIPEELPVITGDSTQIHQVLINLFTNAAYAMKEKGGLLEIELSTALLDKDQSQWLSLTPGNYILISIKDAGVGIPPEILHRIFDPFFTTKPVDEGTGMGLAVVHGIVENHHGTISVESTPGKGSVFNVYLPASLNEHPVVEKKIKQRIKGKGRIIMVDDEPILAEMVKEMLMTAGFSVEAYTNSQITLDAFTKNPHNYDILITDQTMPEMSGVALAEAVAGIRPEFPVILISGQIDRALTINATNIVAVLGKPISSQELINEIKKAIDH
ncbi:MAG: PAS domain S-box protein [SAR324 cluster bacterium]|nr:PAS domain S-box protein [SAR324 cluster bacterium]